MSGSAENNSLRIAIAGFGWWGRHMVNRLRQHDSISVIAIIEPVLSVHADIRAEGLEPLSDLDTALARSDIDAVVLTTPNPVHEQQVIACASAGKHVFCEKPLGLTAASARRSVAAVESAGVQLGIGHERRFEPAMVSLKSAIDAGELGTIMHAEAAFSHDKLIAVPKGDWRTSKAVAPAAGMTAMGIHLTDLLISFFGRVKTVQAMTASRSLGWETGDVVTAQLGFEEGMTATLSAVLHTPHFIRMHVFGTRQWIEILNESHPDTPGGKVNYLVAETGKDTVHKVLAWEDSVVRNLESFAAAIAGQADYPFTTEQMVHNIEVLEAITRSAEDRRTVEISELE
ncbi:Gfo/Idh/MocA family protein [Silicimonas sp. MF1-12-2]|uniref:Gfo/Idh/MocA family protein n=1 Tax=Silicimonas sp. MF1-12-2 TaxID=3384793 RepID=UPI0039B61DDC